MEEKKRVLYVIASYHMSKIPKFPDHPRFDAMRKIDQVDFATFACSKKLTKN